MQNFVDHPFNFFPLVHVLIKYLKVNKLLGIFSFVIMSSSDENDEQFEKFLSSMKETDGKSYRDPKNDEVEEEDESLDVSETRRKQRNYSSDEDEDAFEKFVSSLKNDRVGITENVAYERKTFRRQTDSFIVDDDEVEYEEPGDSEGEGNDGSSDDNGNKDEGGNEEEFESCESGSEENSENERPFSSSSDELVKTRRLFTELHFQEEEELVQRIVEKKTRNDTIRTPQVKKQPSVPKTCFKTPQQSNNFAVRKVKTEQKPKPSRPVDEDAKYLEQISDDDAKFGGTDAIAKKLKRTFMKDRSSMADRVCEIINRRCFDGQLPMDRMTIEFAKRLTKTAGDTTTRGRIGDRTCKIRLSEKVCDCPGRLRDTLIHELCHAAVTMINGVLHHRHGPIWINWTKVVANVFPTIPKVTVTHRYTIRTKYVYVCIQCTYAYGRHSKSIDVEFSVSLFE